MLIVKGAVEEILARAKSVDVTDGHVLPIDNRTHRSPDGGWNRARSLDVLCGDGCNLVAALSHLPIAMTNASGSESFGS
jgi:hypothetical protein